MSSASNTTQAGQPAPTAEEIARALDAIIASLLDALWTRALFARLLGPLLYPLWNRISRTRQRLARAMARIIAGAPTRPTRPRATPGKRGTTSPIPRRRHGWLTHLLGDDIPAYASQLTHLLHQPGVAAALAASPGAARTLRPLCRMLGTDLPPAQAQGPQAAPRAHAGPRPRRPPLPTLRPQGHPLRQAPRPLAALETRIGHPRPKYCYIATITPRPPGRRPPNPPNDNGATAISGSAVEPEGITGAVEKTRTSTRLPPQAPQACASTIPPRPHRREAAL